MKKIDFKKLFLELFAVEQENSEEVKMEEIPIQEVTSEIKMETYKLQDGTEVEVADGVVYLLVDGQRGDVAPVGEHTLEDGRIVVVGEEGSLVEIKDAPSAEEISVETPEEEDTETSEMDMLKMEIENLKAEVEKIKQMISEMANGMNMSNEELSVVKEEVAQLSKMPATTKTEILKSEVGDSKIDIVQKVKNLKDFLNK